MRLNILLHMRDSRDAALREFRESVKRWPDYKRLYHTAGSMALPHWGGNFKVMDGIARTAMQYNTPEEGALIYGWSYLQLVVLPGTYTLRDTNVDWELMKRAISISIGRESTNIPTLEALATSACQMKDRAEARRIYETIDVRAKPGEGRPKVSDACRAFAMNQ